MQLRPSVTTTQQAEHRNVVRLGNVKQQSSKTLHDIMSGRVYNYHVALRASKDRLLGPASLSVVFSASVKLEVLTIVIMSYECRTIQILPNQHNLNITIKETYCCLINVKLMPVYARHKNYNLDLFFICQFESRNVSAPSIVERKSICFVSYVKMTVRVCVCYQIHLSNFLLT